jgi:transposase-like protein
MPDIFTLSQFNSLFPDDDACLEKIKKLKFPKGVHCLSCKKTTQHYKVKNRTAYTCKLCRRQVYPLANTLFDKTSTPLRLWFYAIYLMTQTRADVSAKQLQRELGVTYKTAWRMYTRIRKLMEQNNGELLAKASDADKSVHKWVFFKRFTFSVVETQKETS